MSDSNEREALSEKHDRNREQRLQAVKKWVRYIQEHPPETWGGQQNRLVNAQLESAQQSGLSVEHRRRIGDVGRDE